MGHFACISCGIAQACPSSGSMWAIATNPFIRRMMRCADQSPLSALGVRPDDAGCALQSRRLLRGIWRAIGAGRTLAGV
eukprot:5744801-Pyramimonas_sp.AAC.1